METVIAVAQIVKSIADIGNALIKTVEDATPYAQLIAEVMAEGPTISVDRLAEVQAKVDALSARLQAPLPPEEE